MLNAHPLPFYEGQMHYFRLVPSYAHLWKMVRSLFNMLVCLLPAYSLWFLRGFHHSVFDTLYLEHLFLVSSRAALVIDGDECWRLQETCRISSGGDVSLQYNRFALSFLLVLSGKTESASMNL